MPQLYFLKIDGVLGESQNEQHKDEIEVLNWNWGVNAIPSQATTGRSTGRVSVSPMNFSHHVDRASPVLLRNCLKGTHIAHAVLSVIQESPDSGREYFRLSFDNVTLTSVSLSAGENVEHIHEIVSMAFTKVKEEYVSIQPDGSAGKILSTSFDLLSNLVS